MESKIKSKMKRQLSWLAILSMIGWLGMVVTYTATVQPVPCEPITNALGTVLNEGCTVMKMPELAGHVYNIFYGAGIGFMIGMAYYWIVNRKTYKGLK